MPLNPTRRRVLTIIAAGAASLMVRRADSSAREIGYEWRGVAMGADASMHFSGVDPALAHDCVIEATAEIERLERALSLFRTDSEISRLNRDGFLRHPTGDMRRALSLALTVSERSGGLFDPTVQALWESYADWFARDPGAGVPAGGAIAGAMSAVGWWRVQLAPGSIGLGRGQRITLNGLGQGYVTDRVADLLRARGLHAVLIDLGEQRALGPRADARPWLIHRAQATPIALMNGALATSEGAGCVFGAGGEAHHLLDPRNGRSAAHWRRVTVYHRSAAVADALSTALSIAAPGEIGEIIGRFEGLAVWATGRDGREWRWRSNAGGEVRELSG